MPSPFAVGRYAVTFDEWDAYTEDAGSAVHKPRDGGWGGVNRPVITSSWADSGAIYKPDDEGWGRGRQSSGDQGVMETISSTILHG